MKNVLKKVFALTLALSLSVSVLSVSTFASEFNGWKEEKAAIAVMRDLMDDSDSELGKYMAAGSKQVMLNSADTGAKDTAYTYEEREQTGTHLVDVTDSETGAVTGTQEVADYGYVEYTVTVGEVAEAVSDAIEDAGISTDGAVWRIYHSGNKNNFFFGYTTDGEYDPTLYSGVADVLLYEGKDGDYKSGSAYLNLDGVLVVRGTGTDDMVYGSEGDQEFAAAAADAVLDPVLKLYSGAAADDAAEISYTTDTSKVLTLPTADGGTEYTVTGYGSGTNHIVITGDVTLHLTHVTIENLASGLSAIDIAPGSTAAVIIDGEVSLTGGNGGCGIAVPEGASVNISGAAGMSGADSLSATGTGAYACGIGWYQKGKNEEDGTVTGSGTITVHGLGTLNVKGGEYGKGTSSDNGPEGGPAIGGGRRDDNAGAGTVVLNNIAEVNAYGGSKAAAIGAGFWNACDVTITNCGVYAEGGATAAAIGTSRNSYSGDSSVTVTSSKVTAQGGYYGAGIGTGYYDKSYGDYSRDVVNTIPAMTVTIDGNSRVTAIGGALGAGIGGGYKSFAADIAIGSGCTVTAYAGAKNASSRKIACGIGSGADGSGLFSDVGGSITIQNGADVTAFSYGYENAEYNSTSRDEVLASKWAISRELDDSDTTAFVLQCRFLTSDFFNENTKLGTDGNALYSETLGVLNPSRDNTVTLTNGDTTRSVIIPAGYTCMAKTVSAGTWAVSVNDQNWSSLAGASCSAVTNGAVTGVSSTAYSHGTDIGAYATNTNVYQPYDTNGDTVTISYTFGNPSADFTAVSGVNSFDAVAYRVNVVPTPAPVPTPDDDDDTDTDRTPGGSVTIPDSDTPTAEIPDMDVPQTEAPADADTVEIPDEAAPLSAAPSKTGDSHAAVISGACALASLCGLLYVSLSDRKKKNEI